MSPVNGDNTLRIMHCFRSPVGGIFRHVRDLIDEQVAAGHEIGIICDNNTGGALEEGLLAALQPNLALGLHRLPMERSIGLKDAAVAWNLYRDVKHLNLDVLHSHGAKGGAYARIIGTFLRMRADKPVRLYCPHGGSIHYDNASFGGRVFFALERLMERFTDRLIFVSEYERQGYLKKVGEPPCPISLVFNGLTEPEFEPVAPAANATDFLYIGMMRDLKGVDLFLDALPLIARRLGRPVTATLVGDGPDISTYRERAGQLGENIKTRFLNPMPAREAFPLGRIMVVPSRAESMPYIVLEALAAKVSLIATNVGGIPEIYDRHNTTLVEPDSTNALAERMAEVLEGDFILPPADEMAALLAERFSAKVMAASVMTAYRATLSEH